MVYVIEVFAAMDGVRWCSSDLKHIEETEYCWHRIPWIPETWSIVILTATSSTLYNFFGWRMRCACRGLRIHHINIIIYYCLLRCCSLSSRGKHIHIYYTYIYIHIHMYRHLFIWRIIGPVQSRKFPKGGHCPKSPASHRIHRIVRVSSHAVHPSSPFRHLPDTPGSPWHPLWPMGRCFALSPLTTFALYWGCRNDWGHTT